MQKIEETLLKQVKEAPGTIYTIVITFDPSVEFESLGLKEAKQIMHNIASASLPGREILDLLENEAVVSIELDQETGML